MGDASDDVYDATFRWNEERMSRRPEPAELSLAVHQETGRAWLVSDTGERTKAVWLPKSLVEADDTGKTAAETIEGLNINNRRVAVFDFLVPEWLAAERGLM